MTDFMHHKTDVMWLSDSAHARRKEARERERTIINVVRILTTKIDLMFTFFVCIDQNAREMLFLCRNQYSPENLLGSLNDIWINFSLTSSRAFAC